METIDTSKQFEYEWDRYRTIYPGYETQFLNWIAPFPAEGFKDKDVCDAGCGMGRNSVWPIKYGAKSVYAFDLAPKTVAAAKETLKDFSNARVEQCSIYDFAVTAAFDVCFSIGVIHHLQDPDKALERLIRALRPGGKLVVWLYGYEGNQAYVFLFKRILHPIMKRLHPRIVHALTYLFSVPLFLGLKIVPVRSWYLSQLKRYPFDHLHSIVFDQLVPSIAHYYRRDEVEKLFGGKNLSQVEIVHNHGYSWTVIGTK